jgi:hypothetical protein
MPTTISRGIDLYGIATPITVGTATTTGFSMAGSAGAIVIVSAVSGAASVTFKVRPSQGSTDTPATLVDSAGATVSQTISANSAFELPAGLFAAPWVIINTNAGTADLRVIAKT